MRRGLILGASVALVLWTGCGANEPSIVSAPTAAPPFTASLQSENAAPIVRSASKQVPHSASVEEMLPSSMDLGVLSDDGDAGVEMPDDPEGLLKKSRDLLGQGRVAEALEYIDVLLVMAPDDPELLRLRGVSLMRSGHIEDAMVDLRRCCEMEKQDCCTMRDAK